MVTLSNPELMGHLKYMFWNGIQPCNKDEIEKLFEVKNVVIVGPSASGKSTLVDAVRNSELSRQRAIDVPTRYVTRDRVRDNTAENIHLSGEEFDRIVDAGEIDLPWERYLGNGRYEKYGFAHADPKAKLVLYSANNSFFYSRYSIAPERLETMLFMRVFCREEIREKRLRVRSPELFERETREGDYRLYDGGTFTWDLKGAVAVTPNLLTENPFGKEWDGYVVKEHPIDIVTGTPMAGNSYKLRTRKSSDVNNGRFLDLLDRCHLSIFTDWGFEYHSAKTLLYFLGRLITIQQKS